jgi:hypothetical protein
MLTRYALGELQLAVWKKLHAMQKPVSRSGQMTSPGF